jgi:hypothetical protein
MSLVLTLSLVIGSCLQNHPEIKYNLLRSMEERAEEYKRMNALIQAPAQGQAPTQAELKLVKTCWNQFGLFSCLDDQIMHECVSFMVVCDLRSCILTD